MSPAQSTADSPAGIEVGAGGPLADQRPRWMGVVAGLLLLVAGLAALGWLSVLIFVEYRYRSLHEFGQTVKENDREVLVQYVTDLKKLIKWDPTNGDLRNRYATVLGMLGEHPAAVEALERARRTDNRQNSLHFLAIQYEKLGDVDTAEELMRDCVLLNPTNPEFNPTRLRLLSNRTARLRPKNPRAKPPAEYLRYRSEFGREARDWAIRAPNDPNSYLFLGNFYVDPLYALQSYRCFLMGLSRPKWMNLNRNDVYIPVESAMKTIREIIHARPKPFALPYRGLP